MALVKESYYIPAPIFLQTFFCKRKVFVGYQTKSIWVAVFIFERNIQNSLE